MTPSDMVIPIHVFGQRFSDRFSEPLPLLPLLDGTDDVPPQWEDWQRTSLSQQPSLHFQGHFWVHRVFPLLFSSLPCWTHSPAPQYWPCIQDIRHILLSECVLCILFFVYPAGKLDCYTVLFALVVLCTVLVVMSLLSTNCERNVIEVNNSCSYLVLPEQSSLGFLRADRTKVPLGLTINYQYTVSISSKLY